MAINFNELNKTQTHKPNTDNQALAKKEVLNQASNAQRPQTVIQDSVSITPQALKLNEMQKKENDAPVINQKKVAELKNAITSGEYKINPEKLAANIAEFEFSFDKLKD